MENDSTVYVGALQASKIVGLTTDMLSYLERVGVINPQGFLIDGTIKRGRGTFRIYTYRDLVILKIHERILSLGVSISALTRPMKHLCSIGDVISPRGLPGRFIVINGSKISFQNEPVLNLEIVLAHQSKDFVLVLEIEKIVRDLNHDLEEKKLFKKPPRSAKQRSAIVKEERSKVRELKSGRR